ncbi:Uu.00g146000.m01.CDS01 [Anthostomella pinea]|uniref:Uu.00g146000.m01.CDS01 n=1 Tax=Anthostomella pinea TaxID=933095 RepID=A0AAI8YLY4_9PEZI|nr:Uu.00g146000.m01.CDS01 [Anthostomella pinea]
MVPQNETGGLSSERHHHKNSALHREERMSLKVEPNWARDPRMNHARTFEEFFQQVDWSRTRFGPRVSWPAELQMMVRFMMADTSPSILYWGESHSMIYNEAHVSMVGNNHPAMMGMDAGDVFPDFWDDFDEIIAEQRRTGRTATGQGDRLLMRRRGFLEETYFDWKLIPIVGEDEKVLGSYSMPADVTSKVISHRQKECIKQLNHYTAQANNTKELWEATLTSLKYDDKDLPIALLYTMEEENISLDHRTSKSNAHCQLEGSIGLDLEHEVARKHLDLEPDIDGFAPTMLKALHTGTTLVLEADDPAFHKLLDGIIWKGYNVPSKQFVVMPICFNGTTPAFLIIGLNPYRRCTTLFHEFFQTMADILGMQVERVRLAEEVERHDQLARRAALDFKKSELRFFRFAERSIAGLASKQPLTSFAFQLAMDELYWSGSTIPSVLVTDMFLPSTEAILYANESWYRFSGIDPSEGQNRLSWVDTVMTEDIGLLHEWQDRALKEKKGGTFQVRSKRPFRQGNMYSEHRTGICACYPEPNEAGEVESVMVLIVDISELKWTEKQLLDRTKKLEDSEGKYRNYAEHCPLGICRTDGDGYVQYANNAWHANYNFRRGQAMDPEPWIPFLHDDDVQPCKDFFQKLKKHSGPEAVELRLRDKSSKISEGDRTFDNESWILATGFSEFKDDGTVDYIDFWVTDISAQKMAEKILADKMEEAVRLKTQQERFIDMISHEIRNPLSAVLHCGEEIVDAMKKGRATLDTIAGTSLPPTILISLQQTLPKQLGNALEAANTIMYCVQHQKQIVDDVLTLSKLDSELLVVSPVPVQLMPLVLSSLKIFELELKMTDISLSVVDDKSLANLGVDWVALDPNRFLQIVINLVTNAIKFTKTSPVRQITVTVSALTQRPLESHYGVDYVPQRYAPETPASATSTCAEFGSLLDAQPDIFLSFSVQDTGKGLSKSEKALLFNRFAQASPKTHIEYGGSGLGLFICRQITELLGGEIGIASTPGVGSTFAFYVGAQRIDPPFKLQASNESLVRLSRSFSLSADGTSVEPVKGLDVVTAELPDETIDGENGAPRTVLVVEDNLVNQKVLCKQLRNRDFAVQAAGHGKEALDAMMARATPGRGHYFNVILCDIEMPVMGGIDFAKEVRRLEAQGELVGHVPIIGVTANVRNTQVSGAIDAGMDGVTTKPYRVNHLIEHINRLCPAR